MMVRWWPMICLYTETFFSSCKVLFSARSQFDSSAIHSPRSNLQHKTFPDRHSLTDLDEGRPDSQYSCNQGNKSTNLPFFYEGPLDLVFWLALLAGTLTSYSSSAWLCEDLKLSWRILGALASRSAYDIEAM